MFACSLLLIQIVDRVHLAWLVEVIAITPATYRPVASAIEIPESY